LHIISRAVYSLKGAIVKKYVHAVVCALCLTTAAHAQVMERPTYKVGDAWSYIVRDALTNLKTSDTHYKIAEVNADGYRVIGGTRSAPNITWNTDGSAVLINNETVDFEKPEMQWPLTVGKKWRTVSTYKRADGITISRDYNVEVLAHEEVETPAGKFMAFKVNTSGWHQYDKRNEINQNRGQLNRTQWWSPEVGRPVKVEMRDGGPQDRVITVLQRFTRH